MLLKFIQRSKNQRQLYSNQLGMEYCAAGIKNKDSVYPGLEMPEHRAIGENRKLVVK